ncbi:hypothetical protein B2_20216 [Candidatus Vecturithrix granuli]|uniref:Orc1-like AAA ATPase domain-containing protein n=1 Tax=Vecturithrix granuli TaxID=1499967 RepID=A0A081BVT0_VECG1|nr:hypothetical protein B2_20216 [Candidatus Vecturithrix granuli]
MEQTIFVGREQEVQDVLAFARKGLAGQASVAFVTGEAGMGKTALVEEVFRRLKAEMPDLVMAVGRCNVDSASYLPFRTILEDVLESRTDVQISGELASGRKAKVKDSLISILKDVGTDVMSIFLPATIAGIAGKGSKSLFDKWFGSDAKKDLAGIAAPKDLEQVQVFGWYTRVMENIAAKFPVLLFVDDLHWADASSLNLLLYLGRETVEDRLMLIGTYRPHEVAPDSLLAQNKTRLGRYGAQEFPLDLSETKSSDAEKARQFVHDYLMAKYQTNFSDRFEALLADRTEGNALFLTEILKNMEEKGEIISNLSDTSDMSDTSDSKNWQLTREMTHIDELPEAVENAIKERIGRLEKHLREILDYASVEGDEFIAQVIAKVRQLEEWQLIDDLTEKLQNIHQLIYERGGTSLPNGDRVHGFVFKHNLIREYVYAQLPQTKKELLHAKIGECLEQLYEPETNAIAAELAIHFTQAHVPDKAVQYCLHAAQDANARYGAAEAVNFAKMGLEALEVRAKTLPQSEYAETKIRMLLELAKAERFGGERHKEKNHILTGIVSLEAHFHLLQHTSEMLQADFYLELARLCDKASTRTKEETKNYFEKAFALYEQLDDRRKVAEILYHLGNIYPYIPTPQGEKSPLEKTINALERGASIAESVQEKTLQSLCYGRLAFKYIYNIQNLALAEKYAIHALELARSVVTYDKYADIMARDNLAEVSLAQTKYKTGIHYLNEALELARKVGQISLEKTILYDLGYLYRVYIMFQQKAITMLHKSILLSEQIGEKKSTALNILGELLARQSQWENAKKYLLEAVIDPSENSQSLSRRRIGYLYLVQENYFQAEEEFQFRFQILEKYRRAPDLMDYALMALNYILMGNTTEYQAYIEQATIRFQKETRPHWKFEYLYYIAEVHRLIGEYELAKTECQEALNGFLAHAEDPEDLVVVAEARLNMGKILVDMGDFQEAITYLEQAQTAFAICQHYALGETLLYLGKAHLGLGGVVFRRQAKDYVTKALAEFQRLELRHKEQETQEVLHAL